jgi:hypothetical protein
MRPTPILYLRGDDADGHGDVRSNGRQRPSGFSMYAT